MASIPHNPADLAALARACDREFGRLRVEVEAIPKRVIETSFAFESVSTAALYAPFTANLTEAATADDRHVWVVPFDGVITQVVLITQSDATDVALALHDPTNSVLGGAAEETQTVESFSLGANTHYRATYSFAAPVAAGDLVLLEVTAAAATNRASGWLRLEEA